MYLKSLGKLNKRFFLRHCLMDRKIIGVDFYKVYLKGNNFHKKNINTRNVASFEIYEPPKQL